MSADALALLARVNIVGAVAVLLVLGLRAPVRRAFGSQAAYLLWVLVPAVALAALLPRPESTTILDPVILAASDATSRAVPADARERAADLLFAAWLVGAGGLAAVFTAQQARYAAGLGRLIPDGPRRLRSDRIGAGPAVVGALRPRIVMPADFEDRFDAGEREVVLAHEEAHLARGDAVVNLAATVLLCLCWFNPLAHLAARRLRMDQELACDAEVVARFPSARRAYAAALLKTQLSTQPLPLGCHWPPAAEHPLKERITMLTLAQPGPRARAAGLAVVSLAALAAGAAAWAAQPATQPVMVAAPVWTSRPDGEDVSRVYPTQARAQGLDGRAIVTCRVAGDGRLERCNLTAEAPLGAGFGQAALTLTGRFRMAPVDRKGQPTAGGEIRIPILFRAPAA
ncbi:TonB family protein [Phenylobacterium sp.]|uniref:TonB family protein n=1 Tax=Phenylobacterium sp. TaxID=1871053 RepID=UPI00301BEACE